jgi:hypothetical protein
MLKNPRLAVTLAIRVRTKAFFFGHRQTGAHMLRFAGQVALITVAASGIGKRLAVRFAAVDGIW